MRIPKQFTIMGRTVKIVQDDKKCQKGCMFGLMDFDHNTIYYARYDLTGKKPKRLPKQNIDQTICHELAHFILHTMGESKLCYNEKFVDLLGSCIYMFLTSREY